MLRTVISIFAAAFAMIAGAAYAQQQGQPTELKATHGAWEVHCVQGQPNACYIGQIGNGGNGKPLVSVRIQKTPNLKGPNDVPIEAVIQIQAPLGVLLTAGISLQIDGGEPALAPYKFCTPQNCVVEEPVNLDLIGRMKQGSNANMSVISALSGEKGQAVLSLSGFTKAYNSL